MTDAKRIKALLAERKSNTRMLELLRDKQKKLATELAATESALANYEARRPDIDSQLADLGVDR